MGKIAATVVKMWIRQVPKLVILQLFVKVTSAIPRFLVMLSCRLNKWKCSRFIE